MPTLLNNWEFAIFIAALLVNFSYLDDRIDMVDDGAIVSKINHDCELVGVLDACGTV